MGRAGEDELYRKDHLVLEVFAVRRLIDRSDECSKAGLLPVDRSQWTDSGV